MNTHLFLVSVAVSALCAGSSSAYADNSLRLYGFGDVIPFNTLHTHLSLRPNLSPHQVSKNHSEVKLAQVCWIMDTGECAGLDFVDSDIDNPEGDDDPDGGSEDYVPKGPEDCIKEGYKLTSCPIGYKPNKFCLYDERYFAECIKACPDDYKQCEDPYYGVGEECDGMYKECQCDECDGYNYKEEDIPAGYVKDGEACNSCDGPRYKIKPNPCDGFLDCGSMGCESGAETCLSGDKLLCSNCKPCPNSCKLDVCPANSICNKEDCSGKYCFEKCSDGYEWDNASQSCKKKCENKCSLSSCPANAVCDKEVCSGKYCIIDCEEGYELKNGSCVPTRAIWGQCTGYAAYCDIGDIVYSDGSCNRNIVSGKTPIAVVAYKSGSCAIAVAKDANYERFHWSATYMDVPALKNMGLASDVLADWQGRNNTNEGLKYCKANWNICKPFEYVTSYKTEGTKEGDWYLPAMGELNAISSNMDVLNTTLNKIGGTKISNLSYWSSCEMGETSAWYYIFGSSGLGYGFKTSVDAYVLPVIDF